MNDNRLTIMELVSLQRPSPEERQEVRLKHQQARRHRVRALILSLTATCAVALATVYRHPSWHRFAQVIALILAGYLVRDALTPAGQPDAFMDGYEEGVRAGVNRVLDITQEDEALIKEVMLDAQSAQDHEPGVETKRMRQPR